MKKCKTCGSNNIFYDRKNMIGSHGELKVCEHIEKICTCGKIPPYQIFDDKGVQSWCECRGPRLKLVETKRAFKESQIPLKYQWMFSEDFEIVNEKASMLISIVNTIKDVSPQKKFKHGYYLWGPAGCGKTLFACIILQELMLKYGRAGKFIDLSRQFFQKLRDSYSVVDKSYGETGRILDELIDIPFLVIDDFGVQRNTEWEMEMLYNLIDSRYTRERTTIITSNISIDKFKTNVYGKSEDKENVDNDKPVSISHDRIHSRIQEMCKTIYFDLPDFRKKFKHEIKF
ncbi:ATP-binding protein [Candidatus Latescibacterota bacterium]